MSCLIGQTLALIRPDAAGGCLKTAISFTVTRDGTSVPKDSTRWFIRKVDLRMNCSRGKHVNTSTDVSGEASSLDFYADRIGAVAAWGYHDQS